MWFRRRRRRLPPPVLLPSLDRLSELIERVVELLDGVTLAPQPATQLPPREQIVLKQHNPVADNPEPAADGWVALVASPEGYRLLQREGAPPARHGTLELEGVSYCVLRLGPSPLPGDRRRCAFLEQEPRPAERSSEP